MFHILALTLFSATFIPLSAFVLIWRFYYAGNSNAALGLAQIRNALEGSTRLLEHYERSDGTANDPESESRLKLLLNGPIVRLRIGPASAEQALLVLGSVLDVSSLSVSGDSIVCDSGAVCGGLELDGSWSIADTRMVAAGATAWDALDEAGRRSLANQTPYLRVTRDSSQAIIKLGSSGYIWAITAAYESNAPCFELFHPQLEAVEVTRLTNARGERVGAEIGSLHGNLNSSKRGEVIRYDYFWKNPDDSRDRKKVVLMRYVDGWDVILCAGLYKDEYYLPTKTAESLFFMLVSVVGLMTLAITFTLADRIRQALATLGDFARLTAGSDGSIHSLPRTGLRELDEFGASMSDMEAKILVREATLRKELDDKKSLIEEVHHRVKNNLAVLSSIINLQQDQVTGEEASSVLSIVRGRVNSMALVYQQLLGANEYAALPFNDYIEGILAYHQSGHSRQSGNAVREQHLEPITVGFDIAVPFGLIVNELLSNAFRHGVSTRYPASILVELTRDEESIVFKVQDNGDGMREGTDEGTGLLLVRALCTQLHGTLSIQSPATADSGTVAIVRVPAGSIAP